MPDTRQNNQDTLLGRLIVQHGLATSQDVHDCEQLQRELLGGDEPDGSGSLAELLVANGVVTERQLGRLRKQLDSQPQEHQIPGFQVVRVLGRGAMATVYLAKQLSLDRMVAIKVLPREHTDNAQFVSRFYAEGRAAARLNHPNIVGALDVGQAGNFHYFVMEYVQGKTVLDHLTQDKPYAEPEALRVAVQVARALEHAHNAGLIHRDVKPKNIIITPQGIAKLADMGLARVQSDLEEARAEHGKAYGTPYYIAPEQIRGDLDIDFRADIYGLGATLYHMVTGRVAFDGPNPSSVMQKHLTADLTPPDHINPLLSAGLGEIIELCMAKDRTQRYASTGNLIEDLKAVDRREPPLIARKRFDVAVLSVLEPGSGHRKHLASLPAHRGAGQARGYRRSSFWAAVLGWAAAGAMLAMLVWRGG